MTIKLYNTAKRTKEEFEPLQPGKVGIYACGVTVYDLCHIGHARSAIVFDILVRYFRARGFDVTYVRNFTDVDDKIINRANELGKSPEALAREFIDAYYEDMDKLGVLNADVEPLATQHIEGMIQMIQTLVDEGVAYTEGGDVFFAVERFGHYGELSGRSLEDMKAGSRIAVDEKKRHPMDFVLWKAAKPGEPQWDSPWGPGRPGWHIECSVMSNQYLGATFDIHGGGRDLLFPHHENERAQSMAANQAEFARYWVHNGFVTIESEKMSKSLGNFLTIRDALEIYHPEVLRLFLLSKHYRSPLDFSRDHVLEIQSGLVRIYRTMERMEVALGPFTGDRSREEVLSGDPGDPFLKQFAETMDDDLNTAGALGLVFEKIKEINRHLDGAGDSIHQQDRELLEHHRRCVLIAGRVLGFLNERPEAFFEALSAAREQVDPETVEGMIRERNDARDRKDWASADEIRDRLKGMGIVLEDTPRGTKWRYG